MKRLALITATTLMLASSATAGSIQIDLLNLTFPPTDTDTVTTSKDCLQYAEAPCPPEQ